MAGNLVKWWRNKIGGYKQFSVLQDSATDSEEIIYPIRAPSSCSAPPDLLMTTGQDQTDHVGVGHHRLGLATTTNCHNSPVTSCSGHGTLLGEQLYQGQKRMRQKMLLEQQRQSRGAAKENLKASEQVEVVTEELVRLEELHCDVSLEQSHKNNHHHNQQHSIRHSHEGGEVPALAGDHKAGKVKTQPVQFSFTLYDLDGHGKITKDDIAGIVSTIYESLGKSVVVPHYGSKTINVRLTVSPDSSQNKTAAQSKSASAAEKSKKLVTPRRRYRPRKLMSDDENSDSSNELLNHKNCMSPAGKGKRKNHGSPMKSPLKEFSVMAPVATVAPILTTPVTETNLISLKTPTNSIYMNLVDHGHNLYDVPKPLHKVPEILVSPYHESAAATESSMMARHQQMLLQQKEQRKKLLRKTRSRKQKYPEMVPIARARSLSVGNEQCWKRTPAAAVTTASPALGTGVNSGVELFDEEDQLNGLENLSQIGGGGKSDEECWRSSLRRRELIEIIRESMEKNRLCFQTNNRKPLENASPAMIKFNHNSNGIPPQHRHRAHTINPVAVAAHKEEKANKVTSPAVNLCGYDSYLHATICAGNGHGGHGGATTTTPLLRKKCNQKMIKSRLRHQHLLAQQQQQQQQPDNHQNVRQGVLIQSVVQQQQQQQQRVGGRKAAHHHQKPLQMRRRSKSKEELVTREKLNIVEGLLTTESFIDKLKITEDFAEQHAAEEKQRNQPSELMLEYGCVPVTAEPGECERLLAPPTPSEEGSKHPNELFIEEKSCPGSQKESPTHSTSKSASVHRYGTHVHTHIHHHYHHFENEENVV